MRGERGRRASGGRAVRGPAPAAGWRRPAAFGGLVFLAAGVVQLFLLWRAYRQPDPDFTAVNYGYAVAIGLLVGATEMISRYRDDPFAPLVSVPGAFYVLINGGAAALAYYLLKVLGAPLKEPMLTLVAGLGAMAVFRSGLFTTRVGNTNVAVGPNLVLQAVLAALDRIYDRQRAVPRSEAVVDIMRGLSFDQVADALPTLCFDLMQNVSAAEVAQVSTQKRELAASTTMSGESKVLSLGLALFNVVGEGPLRAAVGALGGSVKGYPRLAFQLLLDLGRLDPLRVVETLPRVCAELPSRGRDEGEAAQARVSLDDLDVAPESAALLTVYKLVDRYGEQRVAAAVAVLLADPSTSLASPATRTH